jgi:hypothetical protein
MDGSAKRLRHWRTRAALLGAIVLTLVLAGRVAAWSQIYNAYPFNPLSCTDPGGYCMEWPTTSGGLSVNVDEYLYSSLALANIPLGPDVLATFPQWNNIAARNPYLRQTTNLSAAEVQVWLGTTIDPASWAETTPSPYCCTSHVYASATIVFRSSVTWNHTYTYSGNVADSRKVADHEMGHVEALGHTSFATALMHTGPASFWTVQSNDRSGIIAVYGAYP